MDTIGGRDEWRMGYSKRSEAADNATSAKQQWGVGYSKRSEAAANATSAKQ